MSQPTRAWRIYDKRFKYLFAFVCKYQKSGSCMYNMKRKGIWKAAKKNLHQD
jgi:hypothetical protein